ncbi:MAG: biotin synthase BioB [Desulfuromonas sp.]|nr:MAG: biotin synthase BioB [Desulfuromonas sp.]
MNDSQHPLHHKVEAGQALTTADGLQILQARGAELTALMAGAHAIKEKYRGDKIGLCSIVNAKSGRCAEDCAFCAQSAHQNTDAPIYPLLSAKEMITAARNAADQGRQCFGIVTSGTAIDDGEEFQRILKTVAEIASWGSIAPSVSLGILSSEQATALQQAGCATYHHNLETARSFFPEICTTHDYEDDVTTVRRAKAAGMKVCCGGIFGLGESLQQRLELALTIRELDVDSVPINFLNPVAGTRLEHMQQLTPLDSLRIIVLYRYLLPDKHLTVCGGREHNLRELQSLIFMAGASGMMVGNYLTTGGRDLTTDHQLLQDLELDRYEC